MLRRTFNRMLLGAGVAAVAAPRMSFAQDDKTIRIGLQPAPLLGFVVKEKKLLEKRGYKPVWNVFPYTPPILEAMAAGSIDIALLGVGPVISVSERNPGIWYIYDELANASGMIVQADSNIHSPKDLKGKKIAYPGKASQLYAQFKMYMNNSGLTDSDMELVQAKATDMDTLLYQKQVDGMLAWPPFTTEPIRLGKARALFTADDLEKQKGGHWLNSGWGVRQDFAKQNEAAVLAVVSSLHEATRMLHQEPDEVYKIFAAATGYTVPEVSFILKGGYDAYYEPKDTAPEAQALLKIFNILTKYNIIRSTGNIEDTLKNLVHPEFVEKVLASEKN